jgi:short-subunit dehydrogenase
MNTDKTALISGASSGIGAAFARQLAAAGYNLILVARREERLAALATELQQRHAISAEVLPADLSKLEEIKRVEERIQQGGGLALLINNAGFGSTGPFIDVSLATQMDMIQVHIVASLRLCRAALPGMLARRQGAIINVSSISAFAPLAGNVNYSATKVYLVNFSEALQVELAGTGVKVQALCPGFTYTEFHDDPQFGQFKHRTPRLLWMSAEEVDIGSLKALEQNRVTYIPGLKNRLLVALVNRYTLRIAEFFKKKFMRKS